MYADLDISVLTELPPNRQAIETLVLPEIRRVEIIERIKELCLTKKQVYWICPLIEESEALQCQAAEETFLLLQAELSSFKIGLIHGKLKSQQKEDIFHSFKKGDIDVLVATTVIEVGVDVPNATLIVIENAERLGLSQLHQLRGRVGRGNIKSYCVLMYKNPISLLAKERLKVIKDNQNGFIIAKEDLKLRGSGELFGIRQTGSMNMKIANFAQDQKMLEDIQIVANDLLKNNMVLGGSIMHRWLPSGDKFIKV
jgi:ATP-dependent DNA helicase RecG